MSKSNAVEGRSDDGQDVMSYTPTELSVHDYVEARVQEMMVMTKAARVVVGNNQPLQKLPRHMRRRAASHNVKRLPRKMHSWANREYAKAGPPSKNKRPSRKHRRRPTSLLDEYSRRKRRNVWLETHIWHAKRFHMTEKWGYKIPLHPNDKGARAAYRATSKYCLLQDFSYYNCIEISGPERDITEALSHLCSTDTGLTFGAKAFTRGTREGQLVVYYYDQYPFGAIGPVKFLWKYTGDHDHSSTSSTSEVRSLWIWVHPAMYMDFIKEVKIAIGVVIELDASKLSGEVISQLSEQVIQERSLTESQICHKQMRKKWKAIKTYKEEEANYLKTTKGEKPKRYQDIFSIDLREFKHSEVHEPEMFSSGTLTVKSLKDSICRFHMTGSLCNEILQKTLQVSDVLHKGRPQTKSKKSNMNISITTDTCEDSPVEAQSCDSIVASDPWWKHCYRDEKCLNLHKQQDEMWKLLKAIESPGELPPSCVLGLTVRDPRKFLPRKKSMIQHENKEQRTTYQLGPFPHAMSWSPLWQSDIREDVKNTKVTNAQINAQRSQLLVPGSELPLSEDESRIPVLLIQNPGHQVEASGTTDDSAPCGLGYGSGWDLIIPSGWSMPFLMNLVYRGARVAGLKEFHSLAVEGGVFSYPNCFPDTTAGREWELFDWKELQAKHERIPPAKRPNFDKLGVVAPFHYPWQKLISEWSNCESSNETPACVSSRNTQQCPAATDGDSHGNPEGDLYVLRSKVVLRRLQKVQLQHTMKPVTGKSDGCLPPAKVSRKSKMMSSVHEWNITSSISEPPSGSQCLVPVRLSMIKRGHMEPFSMICLPTMDDTFRLSNEKSYCGPLENIHKTQTSEDKAKKKATEKISHPQKWELPSLKMVMRSCSRHIIGFIKEGNFSYAKGCGFGVGFVAYQALLELSKVDRPNKLKDCVVLVRNPKSLQYHFANLSILC